MGAPSNPEADQDDASTPTDLRATPVKRPLGVLDLAIDSDQQLDESGWCGTLYPDAREATVHFRGRKFTKGSALRSAPPQDPERKYARDAARAAAAYVRRYTLSNELTLGVTLTWVHEPTSRREAYERMKAFLRRVKRRLGAGAYPWIYVIERGKKHGRLHVHLLTPARWNGTAVLTAVRKCWGTAGRVTPKYNRTDEQMIKAANYLSKDFDRFEASERTRDAASGENRYYAARGFAPPVFKTTQPRARWDIAAADVVAAMGNRKPDSERTVSGYMGVPVHYLGWQRKKPSR